MTTAEKRRSAAGVAFLPLGPGVTPNASKDQEWRQQAAWSYSGILAGAVVISAADYSLTLAISRNPGLTLTIDRGMELSLKIDRALEMTLQK